MRKCQVNSGRYAGVWDCFRHTLHSGGMAAFFQNYKTVLMRDAFFFTGYITTHEALCRWLCRQNGRKSKDEMYFYESFLLGGIAGPVGWLMASPADVVNSRR